MRPATSAPETNPDSGVRTYSRRASSRSSLELHRRARARSFATPACSIASQLPRAMASDPELRFAGPSVPRYVDGQSHAKLLVRQHLNQVLHFVCEFRESIPRATGMDSCSVAGMTVDCYPPPPLTPFDKLRTNGKSGPLMVSQVPLPVHGEPVEPYER